MALNVDRAPALVPLRESGDRYGFKQGKARKLAKEGKLILRKIGSRTYIDHASAMALIAACPVLHPAAAA